MHALNEIDDLLILGTGFDDVDTRARSKSRDRLRRVQFQMSEASSTDTNTSSDTSQQKDDLVVTRVPGGRKGFYI